MLAITLGNVFRKQTMRNRRIPTQIFHLGASGNDFSHINFTEQPNGGSLTTNKSTSSNVATDLLTKIILRAATCNSKLDNMLSILFSVREGNSEPTRKKIAAIISV